MGGAPRELGCLPCQMILNDRVDVQLMAEQERLEREVRAL
jgi:hypothetical protein